MGIVVEFLSHQDLIWGLTDVATSSRSGQNYSRSGNKENTMPLIMVSLLQYYFRLCVPLSCVACALSLYCMPELSAKTDISSAQKFALPLISSASVNASSVTICKMQVSVYHSDLCKSFYCVFMYLHLCSDGPVKI